MCEVGTTNRVDTSKYNVATFLPIFLYEMFSRVAYFYFLLQACLSWWSTVSPFGGTGATAALLFVLLVAAVKAIWEDVKRHQEDGRLNRSIAHRLCPDGTVVDIPWVQVQVGDVLEVRDEELFPADLLCLQTDLPEGVCFIKTVNLDGESNLKIRRALELRPDAEAEAAERSSGVPPAAVPREVARAALARVRLAVDCESPNRDLHRFRGVAAVINGLGGGPASDRSVRGGAGAGSASASASASPGGPLPSSFAPRQLPLTMNEVLLRSCVLKNSGAVRGLVLYTGPESRIQMNAAATPNKVGSFDQFLNLQVLLIMALQMAMVFFCASASLVFQRNAGLARPQLALDQYSQGIYENGFVQWIINLFTFWILLSYLVPISLFVTLEIVKFWQGFVFINGDPSMVDRGTNERARCRNSNLNEDLGKIEYVFSDKTGTLTSNEMQLRAVSIRGHAYGSDDVKLEDFLDAPRRPGQALEAFDARLAAAERAVSPEARLRIARAGGSDPVALSRPIDPNDPVQLADAAADFWISLCLCQSLIIEDPLEEARRAKELERLALERKSKSVSSKRSWFKRSKSSQKIAADDAAGGIDTGNGTGGGGSAPSAPSWGGGAQASAASDPWAAALQGDGQGRGPSGGGPATALSPASPAAAQALPVYQGPSPDEVALASAARALGYEFASRAQASVEVDVRGVRVRYEILNVLEYSSERGCMSVIARSPDGSIRLYCKGSDAKVLGKLRASAEPSLVEATDRDLATFARAGLRTLLLGTRVLEQAQYEEWDARYQRAAASLEGRDRALDELGDEVERDLELVGVTAIEDKLQEGVPAAIQTLLTASIRVWMITGDKMETAVNIAVSCRLVASPDSPAMLVAPDGDADAPAKVARMLDAFCGQAAAKYYAQTGDRAFDALGGRSATGVALLEAVPPSWQGFEMAVDGPTLKHILADDGLSASLALLASRCSGVVVARSSPSQKAAVVALMRRHELESARLAARRGPARWLAAYERRMACKMLGIGDGANDVAMLQTADVGVGILGKEGRQAANNSDYAVGQFRFLVQLLLVHGNLSYYRLARLIKYSFYKNVIFGFVLFYYQFYNGFSGQALVDSITAAVYNVVFTSVPILLFAVLDRPVRDLSTYVYYPQLYDKRRSAALTFASFWKMGVLAAAAHGAVCFFIPYYAVVPGGKRNIDDIYSVGKIVFVAMLGTVTLEMALVSRYWTKLFTVFLVLSYVLVYPYMTVFPIVQLALQIYDPTNVGAAVQVLQTSTFWFSIIACNLLTFSARFLERTIVWVFRPQDTMILSEHERIEKPRVRNDQPDPHQPDRAQPGEEEEERGKGNDLGGKEMVEMAQARARDGCEGDGAAPSDDAETATASGGGRTRAVERANGQGTRD